MTTALESRCPFGRLLDQSGGRAEESEVVALFDAAEQRFGGVDVVLPVDPHQRRA